MTRVIYGIYISQIAKLGASGELAIVEKSARTRSASTDTVSPLTTGGRQWKPLRMYATFLEKVLHHGTFFLRLLT